MTGQAWKGNLRVAPKSRGRKPDSRVRRPGKVPGGFMADLGGGLFAVPPEISAGRLDRLLACGDPADPLLVTALPVYLLDAIASACWLPYERCVDDCMILAHAYAQLGIDAEVRAAEVEVTVRDTGATAAYGSREPRWEDGMMHGHSVVWLGPGHLIDSTVEQFAEIAAGTGPVIIPAPRNPAAGAAPGEADDSFRASLRRGNVLIAYAVAPAVVAGRMLDHPVVADGASGYRRRGMNIASRDGHAARRFVLARAGPADPLQAGGGADRSDPRHPGGADSQRRLAVHASRAERDTDPDPYRPAHAPRRHSAGRRH